MDIKKGFRLMKYLKGEFCVQWNFSQLQSQNNVYNLKFQAIDSDGNSNEIRQTITVDTIKPEITITTLDSIMNIGMQTIGGTYNKSNIDKIIIEPVMY